MPAPIVAIAAVKALTGVLVAVVEHEVFSAIEEKTGTAGLKSAKDTFIRKLFVEGSDLAVKYGLSKAIRLLGKEASISYSITATALATIDTYQLAEAFYEFVDESNLLSGERIAPTLPPRQPGETYRKLDEVVYRYVAAHVLQPKISNYHRVKKISYSRQYATGVAFLGAKEWILNNGKVNIYPLDVTEFTQDLYPYINLPYIINNDEREYLIRLIDRAMRKETNENF